MKIDTQEKKLAYLLGYLQATAEQLSEELKLPVDVVKEEIINGLRDKKKG